MRARVSAVLLVCIGIAMVLGAAARSAAGHAPSFGAAKSYVTGKGPQSVAVADLNGDSTADLVTANLLASTVSILRNQGRGRFAAKHDYRVRKRPLSIVVADLNGDSSPDLITRNFSTTPGGVSTDTVTVLLNRGDARFRTHVDYSGTLVAVEDLNGDGAPDLVTQRRQEGTTSVRLNGGDGSFQAPINYPTGCCVFAVSDLNGDGRPDLAGRGDALFVLLNQGDGAFGTRSDYPAVPGLGPAGAGDLNADGRPDLVTGNADNDTVSVFLNRGDGSYADRQDYPVFGKYYRLLPEAIELGDLNHDGTADLVVGSSDIGQNGEPKAGTVFVLLNTGNGTFRSGRSYRTFGDGELPAIADLNGDSAPDIVDTNLDNSSFSVLVNEGEGAFAQPLSYPIIALSGGGIAISDLNADERPDLVAGKWPGGGVVVRLNKPGLCNVQRVARMTLAAARLLLARVNCRVGKVRRVHSRRVKKGRVISQKPAFGAVRPGGAKVNLVVSRGRR